MLYESKLREEIIKFVEGKLSLDSFEDNFVSNSWNMHQHSSASARALASALELRLAEHSSGHLSENELKSELVKLVSGVMIVSTDAEPAVVASSSSHFSDWTWQQLGQFDGKSHVAACA